MGVTLCDAVSAFSLPVVPRYAEVDQQGVVFNAHYLTWFDEACTGFLDHLGVTYPGLIASGHDIQVVHSEIDYLGAGSLARLGAGRGALREDRSTSFTLDSACCAAQRDTEEQTAVRGRNVYVVVSTRRLGQTTDPECCAKRSLRLRVKRKAIAVDGARSGTVVAWATTTITSENFRRAWPSNSTWPTREWCRSGTGRS